MKFVSVLLITSLILHRGRAVEVHVDEDVDAGGHMAVGKRSIQDSKTTKESLSNVVSQAVSVLGTVGEIVSGVSEIVGTVELISSFFTKPDTSPNEDYWKEVREQEQYLVQETIDASIISQAEVVIDRLSEDLQLYSNATITFEEPSAYSLCSKMDTELEIILSTYAGIQRPEKVVLSYLDMATTRISLWQTTALRYIGNYNFTKQVCQIVEKWSLVFETEINKIETVLRPAIISWNQNYINKLTIICSVDKHRPSIGHNKDVVTCKINDGYNAEDISNWEKTCGTSDDYDNCPEDEFVCFQYCPYHDIFPFILDNINNYNFLNDLMNNMTSNFMVVKKAQLDEYMKECNLTTTTPTATTATPP